MSKPLSRLRYETKEHREFVIFSESSFPVSSMYHSILTSTQLYVIANVMSTDEEFNGSKVVLC